jgi:hypothetical protein
MGTWSVDGMFNTIETDIEHLQAHLDKSAGPEVPNVFLRCFFDPQFSYPARYHRTELSNVGGNQEVSWEVIRFEILSSAL